MANPKVFFDLAVDGQYYGRIVMELFKETTPLAAENFRALCTGEKGIGINGKPLHYKGSTIDFISPNYMLYGGKLSRKVAESIYGYRFKDENFDIKHDRPGILSMAKFGNHTNASEFIICLNKAPDLDGKNVAFGQVVDNLDVFRKISKDFQSRDYYRSKPIVIFNCGEISSTFGVGVHELLRMDIIQEEDDEMIQELMKIKLDEANACIQQLKEKIFRYDKVFQYVQNQYLKN